jgi:photosystem II stability/assembly factor-like uncharacterized protein
MKHLKKSYILLILITVTVIIGSRTFAKDIFSSLNVFQRVTANAATTNHAKPRLTNNIVLQSTDGGQTWQDISSGLPEIEQPQDFFTDGSDVYLRGKDGVYRSKSNLKTPVWEKENSLGPGSISIAFNRSGIIAFNHKGQIYKKMSSVGNWMPIYKDFKTQSVQSVFETSDGTVFVGCINGLYKSIDKGINWKRVQQQGVIDIVESQGVLVGTGRNGIMRSTDNGDNWEWVISEGGVGIAVEVIDGGFAAISYSEKAKSRRINISMDGGKTWQAIDDGLPPSPSISSIKQVGKYLLCGHPDGIFSSSDMGKTWNVVHPQVDNRVASVFNVSNTLNGASGDNRKVFKLYVSGNVLYAVARNFGC